MPIVQLPNGTSLSFPDGMSEDAMSSAIYSNFPEYAPDKGYSPAKDSQAFNDYSAKQEIASNTDGQLVRGAKSGAIGLKSMWESAGVLKDAGAAKSSQDALKLFDDIETGRTTQVADTRTPQQKQRGDLPDFATQQARQYANAAPDVREAMRGQLSGDLANRKELVAASVQTLKKYQEESQKTKGRVTDLTDVAGVNDFKDWLAFNAGSGAVSMVPIILAAAATGGVGAGAVGYGMAAADINQDRIDDSLKKGANTDALMKRVQDTAGSTLGAAVPYAAADVLLGPTRGIIANAGKQQLKKQTLKEMAKEVSGDLLEEAIGEGSQEAIKIGTSVGLGEQEKFATMENAKQIFNAAAAGAAGAPVGSAMKAGQNYLKAAPDAPTIPPTEPSLEQQPTPAEPLRLGNTPDPFISFPDGTVARKSEIDAYVSSLPEDQQIAVRAKLAGLAPQPARPDDILKTESVNDAIGVFNESLKNIGADWQALDVALSSESSNIAARLAGQEWQAIAPEQSGSLDEQRLALEREGAARSAERDATIAELGQQYQALGITNPADDLQAQRAGMRPTPEGANVSTESPLQSPVATNVGDVDANDLGSVGLGDAVPSGLGANTGTAQIDSVGKFGESTGTLPQSAINVQNTEAPAGAKTQEAAPTETRTDGASQPTATTELSRAGDASVQPEGMKDESNGFASWRDAFEKAKSDNDLAAIQSIYDKVRISLNGPAQARGEAAVEQFQKLKSEIEQYATNSDKANQRLVPKSKRVSQESPVQPVPSAGAAIESVATDATVSANTPAQEVQTGPVGRNNIPLSDGGKPYKTKLGADTARKGQTMMRTKRVEGGYALVEKSPKQLAAEARAAKRISQPRTSPKGEPIPAHAMIASAGGLSLAMRADIGIDGNPRVGNRALFAAAGGLTIEEATEKLIEDGYLQEGATHSQAMDLIKRSITNPQYTPEGTEQMAAREIEQRQEAEEAEALAIAEVQALDDNELDALIEWDSAGNTDTEAAMRALGFSEQEIQDAIATETGKPESREASGSGPVEIAQGEAQADSPSGEAAPEELSLSAPSREDVLAQQDALEAEAKRKEDGGDKPIEKKVTADQVDLFNPQAGIFDAPVEPEQSPAAEATAILDAAEVTGSERVTAMIAVNRGDLKPDELKAAYPAKIDDVGEKIGGARKDTAVSTGPKRKNGNEEDDRPTWAKRFQIAQVAGGFDASVNGRDITGKWTISDLRTKDRFDQPKRMGDYFNSKEEAEAALPLIAVAQKHRVASTGQKNAEGNYTYEIWRDVSDRKRVKVVDQVFDSREEAMKYMAQNATEILDTNTTFGEADLPKPDNTGRTGVERRTGDVKGEDFRDAFGFRGVEFGLWNNQDERQEVMNAAYDGLMDLADVLKVPPKAIGLNGDLALAFGARGKGLSGARAHYERDRVVMNLTKMNGAGALAHEWFHALDHYLARQDGKTTADWKINKDGTRSLEVIGGESDMASGGFKRTNSGVREELRTAYTSLVQSLFTKAEQYVEDTAKADKFVAVARGELEKDLNDLRKDLSEQKDVRYYKRNNKPASAEQLAEFDAMAAELVEGRGLSTEWKTMPGKNRLSIQTRHTNETLEKLNELYKTVRGRSGFNAERRGVLDALTGYMKRYDQRLQMLREATALTSKTKRVPTSFAMDAKSLDQGRGGDYWTSPHEMVARAFQGYVEDAIAAKEGRSPFLNYAPENAGIITPWGAKRPYPAGAERKAMNSEFEKFIDVLETKETDQGVAMYARSAQTETPAFKQWFGDSKVVDADGNPLVVYHGSMADITAFDSKASKFGNKGLYFTADPDYANAFARPGRGSTEGNSTVYPVYVSIKNPLVLRESFDEYSLKGRIAKLLFPNDTQRLIEKTKLSDSLGSGSLLTASDVQALRDAGYDGVITGEGDGTFIALDSTQIKSATGNNGDFDGTNPDIRFARDTQPQRGLPIPKIQAIVDDLAKTWTDGPKIKVVATTADLPVPNAPSDVRGLIYQGTAYVVAENHTDLKGVAKTLAHEAIGHYGLWKMLGGDGTRQFQKNLQLSLKAGNKQLKAIQAKVRELYIDENGDFDLNEAQEANEIAAFAVENAIDENGEFKPGFGFLKSVFAKITEFLRSKGFDIDFTNAELQGMLVNAMKGMEAGKRLDGGRVMVAAARDEQDDGAYARSQIVGKTNPHSWNAPEESKFDDLVYKLQDKQIDTKRVVDEIRKTGKALSDEKDVYLQEELFHGRAAARTEDFVNNELGPLVKEMKMRGIDIATLDEYLHARHAEEANKLIADREPGMPDGGSGMTTKAARDYLTKLDPAERKRLESVAAKVDAILGKTRQMYADYNLESQDTVTGWGKMFKNYVPLMREDKDGGMGIGQGFSIKGKETKGRTGSTRKVVDILANIAMQRERAIVRGEKNRVATALVGLAASNKNEGFWSVGPPPTERVYDPKTNQVVDRADPMYKSRENVVVAKVKDPSGEVKEVAVVFNEDNDRAVRMAAALKNLDAAQLNGLLGVSAKISRYFAAVNTQWNPIFGTVNLVRDFQGALLNLSTTPLKNHKAEIAGHTLAALKGVYLDARAARDGKPQTSAWAKLWEEFQNEGGQTGYRDMFASSADRAKAIEHELNPTKWMDSPLGKIFTAGGALKVPLEIAQKRATGLFGWLSDYNLAMENAVRLSAYKVGLEQGMSKQQAASLAKNLTVNFNRKGQVGQQAGAVYAFFNASMQGSARIGQTLFDMDGSDAKTIRLSATGKKIVAGGVLLGVAQALLLAAAGFDDEEPPDFVRERSLIIPTGGKTYITIPMPLGLHVLPNMGRIPTEFVLGGFKNPVQSVTKLLGLTAGAFNPIGGGASLVQMLSPTAVDPLVALAENKDWTGKPIAKTSYNKATPGFALTKDTASAPAKVLAEAFNALSGGTKYTAGVFSPTPDQIDYLWGQATGGVGRELSKAQQAVTAAATGEDLPIHKIPLVGRFYGDADTQSAQSSKFYSTINRMNEHEAEIKGLRKDGKGKELSEYMHDNPDAKLFKMANDVELKVQKMRKLKRELMALNAPAERIKAIEDRITQVMTDFNKGVAEVKKREAATAQ